MGLLSGEETRDTLAAQPVLDGCPACDPEGYR
jgi:hypothetical protein